MHTGKGIPRDPRIIYCNIRVHRGDVQQAASARQAACNTTRSAGVGLDTAAAVRFLDSDDLVAHVWHSYGYSEQSRPLCSL